MAVIAQTKERGFTLIELIMVIVILGILSAFALPKFADFSGDAEASSIEGARGSVRSASAISHAACLAATTCTSTGDSTVTMEGEEIDMVESYPNRDEIVTLATLDGYHTVDSTNTVSGTAIDTIIIAIEDRDNAPCFAYRQAHANPSGATPAVPVVASVSALGVFTSSNSACSGTF
jgi:MSHA pilin protein MshA